MRIKKKYPEIEEPDTWVIRKGKFEGYWYTEAKARVYFDSTSDAYLCKRVDIGEYLEETLIDSN